VREQHAYSKKMLMELFCLDENSFVRLVERLKFSNVLNINRSNDQNSFDFADDDTEIFDIDFNSDRYDYVFNFVGILSVGNIVIKSFPKYISDKDEPLEEMKEVLDVLNKYNSQESIISLYNGFDNQKEFNLLSVALYLIEDYYENGVYKNQERIIENNGDGEILWDKTINDTFAIIVGNRPVYLELKTLNSNYNDHDYITMLHKFILTDCCNKLKNADLLELFDIDGLELSDNEIEYFGDKDYILYRIQKELNVQFITRKQILLKTLYLYIEKGRASSDNLGFSLYGTTNFPNVWEKVCSEVFSNQLHIPLEMLKLPVDLHEDYVNTGDELLDIIEKPIWTSFDSNKDHEVNHTLIPDLISFFELEGELCFGIFDAKYYDIVLDENNLENNPGVGDVTKQYLYQLVYNDFIVKHGFTRVTNAFLMPSESESSRIIGQAKMNILEGLSNPPLSNIFVIKLSASKMFKHYLTNKKLDVSGEFDLSNM